MLALAYRDRNVHELVCHTIAEQTGEYERRGVEVATVDIGTTPEAPLCAGLGGCALEAVTRQRRWVVRYVHTVTPLFWIWAGAGATARSLQGRRIATHPEGSIPWRLAARVLCTIGLSLDSVAPVPFPAGPDADLTRLDAVVRGDVHAAIVGSSVPPSMAEGCGLTQIAFFGDVLTIPTTGVAVDASLLDPAHPAVEGVVEAQRAALQSLRRRDDAAITAVLSLLPRATHADAASFVNSHLSRGYGVETQQASEAGAHFVRWLAGEVGAPEPDRNIYELVP